MGVLGRGERKRLAKKAVAGSKVLWWEKMKLVGQPRWTIDKVEISEALRQGQYQSAQLMMFLSTGKVAMGATNIFLVLRGRPTHTHTHTQSLVRLERLGISSVGRDGKGAGLC